MRAAVALIVIAGYDARQQSMGGVSRLAARAAQAFRATSP
jgi:hypothetical protein